VYIARRLLGLAPVPPSFRTLDPNIPEDDLIAAKIDDALPFLDFDGNGPPVDVATDIVYLARSLLDLPPVPASFRTLDPTIPSDEIMAAVVSQAKLGCAPSPVAVDDFDALVSNDLLAPAERDFRDSEKVRIVDEVASRHPAALRLADATVSYNAHGKTFDHRNSWINNDQVSQILTDAYQEVTGPAMIGDIVMYRRDGTITHNGEVMSVRGTDGEVIEVQSKWGSAGEYSHAPGNVPALYGSPTIYRRTAAPPPCEQTDVTDVTDEDMQVALVVALNGLSDPWGKDFQTVLLRSESDLGCTITGPPPDTTSGMQVKIASVATVTDSTDCHAGCSQTEDCAVTRTCSDSTPCPPGTECIEGHCYNPCCHYCGPGSASCRSERFSDNLSLPRVNGCLNRACFRHDVCCNIDCVDAKNCYFTPQGDGGSNERLCDARLMRACSSDCAPLQENSPSKYVCDFVDCMKRYECTGRANVFQFRRFPGLTPPDECLHAPCSGEGTTCPAGGGSCAAPVCLLAIGPESLTFSAVVGTCDADYSFTIQNQTGCAAITGTASTLAGPGLPFTIVSGGSFNIPAAASHDVTVRFCPQASGPVSSPVDFSTNRGNAQKMVFGAGVLCNHNNSREGVEQCDGSDDAACPGLCQPDCTCGAPAQKPDLIISIAPTLNRGDLIEGYNATFEALAKNNGPSPAGSFYNQFYVDLYNDNVGPITLSNGTFADVQIVDSTAPSDHTISSLGPGSTAPVNSGIWTAVRGEHRIIVCADDPSAIVESDESNNCSNGGYPTHGTGIVTVGKYGQI
jgi:hypothetical protein